MGNESFNRRLIDEYLNQHKTKSNELVNTLSNLRDKNDVQGSC